MNIDRQRFIADPRLVPDGKTDALWFVHRGNDLLLRQRPALDVLVHHDPRELLGDALLSIQSLGTLDGRVCFCAEVPAHVPVPEAFSFVGLRALWGQFDDMLFALAMYASQLTHFTSTFRFCSRCAGALVPVLGHRSRRCSRCEAEYWPPVVPAAIVLVTDGPRVLMTRSPRHTAGMYGLIAGFVEPGESLEECLHREAMEETGVQIANVKYFSSQPWPFPSQLMVGYTATYAGGEIVIDRTELEDARWFHRDELPILPTGWSIARRLIEDWLAR